MSDLRHIEVIEKHIESLKRITAETLRRQGGWDYSEEIEALEKLLAQRREG